MSKKELEKTQKQEMKETTRECRCYTPHVDVWETKDAITMLVDMPGVDKAGMKVSMDGDLLEIEGGIQQKPYEGLQPLYAEYNVGNYYRRFTVSDEIARDRIEAKISDGSLTLTLPKTERAKPREIPIRT